MKQYLLRRNAERDPKVSFADKPVIRISFAKVTKERVRVKGQLVCLANVLNSCNVNTRGTLLVNLINHLKLFVHKIAHRLVKQTNAQLSIARNNDPLRGSHLFTEVVMKRPSCGANLLGPFVRFLVHVAFEQQLGVAVFTNSRLWGGFAHVFKDGGTLLERISFKQTNTWIVLLRWYERRGGRYLL